MKDLKGLFGRSLACALLMAIHSAKGQEILYGGSGVGSTDNVGALITINQTNGAGTLVGTPDPGFGLSGISFNSLNQLYATTVGGGTFPSSLLLVDPSNGNLLSNIGTVMAGTQALKIGDLAFQPNTNVLYGITANNGPSGSPGPGVLYTIDLTTGAATLVGDTGSNANGAIGFAPDGTLYYVISGSLKTLNPANGTTLSSTSISGFFDALCVRSDGVLFASPGNSGDTYTINPVNGATTNLGNSGLDNAVSDLAFSVVPEPGTLALALFGAALVIWISFRRRIRASKV